MLEEKDYQKIAELFEEKGGEFEKNIILQVGEVIEQNILPTMEIIHKNMEDLQKKINNLPDKAYLDNKLAHLEGESVVRQRKEDQKVNLLIELLRNKKLLVESEVKMLHQIEVFPAPPAIETRSI